jgi:hypothetical protein
MALLVFKDDRADEECDGRQGGKQYKSGKNAKHVDAIRERWPHALPMLRWLEMELSEHAIQSDHGMHLGELREFQLLPLEARKFRFRVFLFANETRRGADIKKMGLPQASVRGAN